MCRIFCFEMLGCLCQVGWVRCSLTPIQVWFLAFGFAYRFQIKSTDLCLWFPNVPHLGLAIVGGSWMPIPCFKVGSEHLWEWTPVYHVNELRSFAKDGRFSWKSLLFIFLAYTVVATGLALFIHLIESDRVKDNGYLAENVWRAPSFVSYEVSDFVYARHVVAAVEAEKMDKSSQAFVWKGLVVFSIYVLKNCPFQYVSEWSN